MLSYQPVAFSPRVPPPTPGLQGGFLGQVAMRHPGGLMAASGMLSRNPLTNVLGRSQIGQTFDELFSWPPAVGDLLRVAFHGGTTWLGIRVGLTEKNKWVSSLAWVLAVGNGIAGLADVISLIKRATGTHPPPAPPAS